MKKFTIFILCITSIIGNAQSIEGTWKMNPQAGAMGVGQSQGDTGWWSSSAADVTTRACFFDDEFVFTASGGFSNVQGAQTWVEAWQGGGADGCRAAVAPHNGSNPATYTYDAVAGTLTINGVGAHLGLAKVYNGGELTSPAGAPAFVTYKVTSFTATTLTLDISTGGGWWRFVLQKQVVASPIEGTWKMLPQAGALGVGPNLGDIGWWSNNAGDVATRACFFDDEYVFTSAGGFSNVQGTQTWVEAWQGGGADGCRAAVAPHNASNPATYTYNVGTSTLTINGTGAYNGGELTSLAVAPSSITYTVTAITATEMTLDISVGGGWWRFKMLKLGTPTCNDGIMNGTETGIDCGGSCPACVTPPMVAAPTPPARPAADVVSIFSDAYTSIAINAWGPNWGGSSARINDFPIQSNPTKVMDVAAGQVFAGIDFAPTLFDATSLLTFHMDYYISAPLPAGQTMSIKLSNHNGGSGETSAIEFVPTPQSGQWVSIDIPLSNFTAASVPPNLSRNAIAQIVITAARTDNNVPVKIYMDNIYLHKNTILGTQSFSASKIKMYPNPATNMLNIEALNEIENISVYNLLGQEVISKTTNNKVVNLDIASINSGIYIIKTTIDGVVSASRFVKE
jgi:hypothetical protein